MSKYNNNIFYREDKSNFSIRQVLDPIGLFGGKKLWDMSVGSPQQKAAYAQQQEAARQEQEAARQEMERRIYQQKAQSAENAYEIRRQLKQAESSTKLKSGLIIGGIVVVSLTIAGLVAYKVLKKK